MGFLDFISSDASHPHEGQPRQGSGGLESGSALRQQLGALRAVLDSHLADLDQTVAAFDADEHRRAEDLVCQLTTAATTQAQEEAARARAEAEEQARTRMAQLEEEFATRLAGEREAHATRLQALKQAAEELKRLQAAQQSAQTELCELQAQLAAERDRTAAQAHQLQQARSEVARLEADAQIAGADVAGLQGELASERDGRVDLEDALAAARAELAESRTSARALSGDLQTLRIEVQNLEEELQRENVARRAAERTQASLEQARDESLARADRFANEVARLAELAGHHERGRAEAQEARDAAHAHAGRLGRELSDAVARVAALERASADRDQELERLREQPSLPDAEVVLELDDAGGTAGARVEPMVAVQFERLRRALEAIADSEGEERLLQSLFEQLAYEFPTVALFLQRHGHLDGWKSRGFDASLDIAKIRLPLTADSIIARAAAEKEAVVLHDAGEGAPVGLFGRSVEHAFAWPVVVDDEVIAVAYGEQDAGIEQSVTTLTLVGDILVEQVARCLAGRQPQNEWPSGAETGIAPPSGLARVDETPHVAGAPAAALAFDEPLPEPESMPVPYDGPQRESERFRVRDGVEVQLEGATCRLIDLSVHGAQVLSPKPVRPHQLIRVTFAAGVPVSARARIMWARFELSPAGDTSAYRAGMRFTDLDPVAAARILEEYVQPRAGRAR